MRPRRYGLWALSPVLLSCAAGAGQMAPVLVTRSVADVSNLTLFVVTPDVQGVPEETKARAIQLFEHALSAGLSRAGFQVVTERTKPHELEAKLSVLAASDTHTEAPKTHLHEAQMELVLERNASVIDRAGARLTAYDDEISDTTIPIMINEVSGSPKVAALASSLREGDSTGAEPGPGEPPRPKAAGAKTVVAVFSVEDPGKQLDPKVAEQLTDYLSAKLTEVMRYRVIPRDQLRSRLQESKAESYQSCFDETCQMELGKALAAQKSLATKLLRVGNSCALTSTLYDLKTETTEQAASARTECSDNALMTGVDQVVQQLQTNAGR